MVHIAAIIFEEKDVMLCNDKSLNRTNSFQFFLSFYTGENELPTELKVDSRIKYLVENEFWRTAVFLLQLNRRFESW